MTCSHGSCLAHDQRLHHRSDRQGKRDVSQSAFIVSCIVAAFLVFITAKGEAPTYIRLLI